MFYRLLRQHIKNNNNLHTQIIITYKCITDSAWMSNIIHLSNFLSNASLKSKFPIILKLMFYWSSIIFIKFNFNIG